MTDYADLPEEERSAIVAFLRNRAEWLHAAGGHRQGEWAWAIATVATQIEGGEHLVEIDLNGVERPRART